MRHCVIHNKDSRYLSSFLKKNSVDFIVFSPPYWNIRNYRFKDQIGFKQSYEDYLSDMEKVFKECYEVLKDGRFMAINIGTVVSNNDMKFIAGNFVNNCQGVGFTFRKDIIWHKPKGTTKWQRGATQFSQNPFPLMYNTNINHEYVLIFQKGDNKIKKPEKIRKFSKNFVRKMVYSVWDIIPVNSPKGDEKHVAPFPEELPKRLIQLYTFKKETVLDPFAGCGTTNKVAKQLGRYSIAVEMSKDYCDLIRKKVSIVAFDSNIEDIYKERDELDFAKDKLMKTKKEYDKTLKEYNKILKSRNQGKLFS